MTTTTNTTNTTATTARVKRSFTEPVITRTISLYKLAAYGVRFNADGMPEAYCLGECEAQGTSFTDTQIRATLRAHGFEIPQGCILRAEPVSVGTYELPLRVFLQYATKVSEK